MTKAPSVNPPSVITLWPWVIGEFLLGFAASILMPTLLLALILGLSAWGLVRWGHQTPASRKAVAIDLGLGIAATLFLIVLIAGNITR
jgi:hypothetical protein